MKTRKIRIAVAMAPDGEWNSCGYSLRDRLTEVSDKDKMDGTVDCLPERETRYFVEAEIPIPDPEVIATIIGTVTPVKDAT
jgi:hypothetical protein